MSHAHAPESAAHLLLVRHGHCDASDHDNPDARLCGWHDPPLSIRGCREAAHLAWTIAARWSPGAVYASPLQRTFETARLVGAAVGVEPVPMAALREISCGHLDGLRLRDVRTQHTEVWARNQRQADPDFRWPGGESYREFRQRVIAAIDEIARWHPAEQVIVVTHSGVINQAIGTIRRVSPARWEPFRPSNASITEIRWQGEHSALIAFNHRVAPLDARPRAG